MVGHLTAKKRVAEINIMISNWLTEVTVKTMTVIFRKEELSSKVERILEQRN